MKVFRTKSNVAYPKTRSELLSHRLLRPHEEYLVDDTIAAMLENVAESGHSYGEFADVIPRPMHPDMKSLLILFPGGLGDVVCLKACLLELRKWYPRLQHVAVVSSVTDKPILLDMEYPFSLDVIEYPIMARLAQQFESWVAFGAQERQSLRKDMVVSFSEQLGMQPPENGPELKPSKSVMAYMYDLLPKSALPRVGIQIHSAAHYRSWHAGAALITMAGLVESGFDCFVLGTAKQHIIFRDDDGNEQQVWGDGKYDMSGMDSCAEEMIALAALMDIIIAPDSGFLHIGCALGKPTIGLFGLTHWESREKYYPTMIPMQGSADCSPCWCIAEIPPCEKPQCEAMMDISPADIVDEVKNAWRSLH